MTFATRRVTPISLMISAIMWSPNPEIWESFFDHFILFLPSSNQPQSNPWPRSDHFFLKNFLSNLLFSISIVTALDQFFFYLLITFYLFSMLVRNSDIVLVFSPPCPPPAPTTKKYISLLIKTGYLFWLNHIRLSFLFLKIGRIMIISYSILYQVQLLSMTISRMAM